MQRRTYLGRVGVASTGLTGYTASALPGPDDDEDGPPTHECPDLLETDRAVCSEHTAVPIAVDRSSDTVSGEGWRLRITVTNVAADPYGYNPHAWSVHREAGDGWTRVAPDVHIEPWVELLPGDRYEWELSAVPEGPDDVDQRLILALEPTASRSSSRSTARTGSPSSRRSS